MGVYKGVLDNLIPGSDGAGVVIDLDNNKGGILHREWSFVMS